MSSQKTKELFNIIEQWPISKASKERKEFIEKLNSFVFERLNEGYKGNLSELVSKTVYLEKQRIKLNPWKVDPVDDKGYWNNIGTQLDLIQNLADKENAEEELLKRIINRYSEEIVGHFDKKTFLFSRWFLTTFFKRLFNKYLVKISGDGAKRLIYWRRLK
jgi:glycerol-3-phosphate O-acyltransferase